MATSPPGIPPEIQELVRSEGKKLAARLTQDMKRRERRLVADMKKREKGIMHKVLSALSSSGERGEMSFIVDSWKLGLPLPLKAGGWE